MKRIWRGARPPARAARNQQRGGGLPGQPSSLFQAISASLRRTFGLDYASLLIYDAEAGALRLQMLDFPDGSGAIRENAVIRWTTPWPAMVFRTREARAFTLEEAARHLAAQHRRHPGARGPAIALLHAADRATARYSAR